MQRAGVLCGMLLMTAIVPLTTPIDSKLEIRQVFASRSSFTFDISVRRKEQQLQVDSQHH
jgi:hypothetical protein